MSFANQIRQHSEKYQRRMGAVFRESTQETVNDMLRPRAKGGRFPVDTGFMRAASGAGINQMPSGPTKNEGGNVSGQLTGMGLTEALARWKPGDTLFYGLSAVYSRVMEYRYGFMRGATDKWTDTVNRVARAARNR